jgi:hypothetical protein
MAKTKLTVAEENQAKGLVEKIDKAVGALQLREGVTLGLRYMTPPTSDKIRSKVALQLRKKSLKVRFKADGIDVRKLAAIRS